jgi:hypothetical protein
MTRRGRENLFVGVAVAAIGAWWLAKNRKDGPGAHRVGQDLASYFRRGFGLPPVRIEIAPWRRRYYPAAEGPGSYAPTFPSGHRSTYPQTYQPYQTQPYQTQPYQPYQTQPYQPPQVTYRSWSSPAGAVRQGVQVLPPPPAPKGGHGRSDFANRWRVEKAQRALNAIYGGLLEEDGVMGPKTVDAIQMFQRDHGMPETGGADDRTSAALETAAQGGAAQAPEDRGFWDWERPGATPEQTPS